MRGVRGRDVGIAIDEMLLKICFVEAARPYPTKGVSSFSEQPFADSVRAMSDHDVVARYFRAVEAGDVEGAAACFAEDAVYSHPALVPPDGTPPGPTPPRVEARGREGVAAFLRERGNRPVVHEVTTVARAGDVLFVEGVAHRGDGAPFASFVSVARVDGDGLIRHYSAYTATPVAGALMGVPIS